MERRIVAQNPIEESIYLHRRRPFLKVKGSEPKNRWRGTPLPDLSDYVLAEVLVRLPARSVARFRCASRAWSATFCDRDFMARHHSIAISRQRDYTDSFVFHYFDPDGGEPMPTLHLVCSEGVYEVPIGTGGLNVSLHFQIVGSCNGLLCLLEGSSMVPAYVCNPLIGKCLALPRPATPVRGIVLSGFGFDPKRSGFKAVTVWYEGGDRSSEVCAIGPSGVPSPWRSTAPLPDFSEAFVHFGLAVVEGNIHWIIGTEDGRYGALSFDPGSEQFRILLIPDEGTLAHVSEWKGHLSILCGSAEKNSAIEVWVMKEYGNEDSWIKELSIRNRLYNFQDEFFSMDGSFLCAWKDGEILVGNGTDLISYDTRSKHIRDFPLRWLHDGSFIITMTPHVNTLLWLEEEGVGAKITTSINKSKKKIIKRRPVRAPAPNRNRFDDMLTYKRPEQRVLEQAWATTMERRIVAQNPIEESLFLYRRRPFVKLKRSEPKKRRRGTPSPDLSDDVLAEVLVRLPARSVARFRCASSAWNATCCDRAFIARHHSLAISRQRDYPDSLVLHYFDSGKKKARPALHLVWSEGVHAVPIGTGGLNVSPHFRIVGWCDGLFCLSKDPGLNPAYVCNPLIGKCLALPGASTAPSPFVHLSGFGFDPKRSEFKAVRVWDVDDHYVCDVCAIGASGVPSPWRTTAHLPVFNGASADSWPVVVGGNIHWIVSAVDDRLGALSFDPGSEQFHVMCFPQECQPSHVAELKGHLSILCADPEMDSAIEVWVMKEYGNEDSWIKAFSIRNRLYNYQDYTFSENASCLCAWKDGEILVGNGADLISYDPRSKHIRDFPLRWLHRKSFTLLVMPYVSSLLWLEEDGVCGSKDDHKDQQKRKRE